MTEIITTLFTRRTETVIRGERKRPSLTRSEVAALFAHELGQLEDTPPRFTA